MKKYTYCTSGSFDVRHQAIKLVITENSSMCPKSCRNDFFRFAGENKEFSQMQCLQGAMFLVQTKRYHDFY